MFQVLILLKYQSPSYKKMPIKIDTISYFSTNRLRRSVLRCSVIFYIRHDFDRNGSAYINGYASRCSITVRQANCVNAMCRPNAPFTPVRQTIHRPLQSSVVHFSENRSDRNHERPFTPSPSSVVRHTSSVKIGPGAILTDEGWRMQIINHGNELWIA